MDPDIAARIRDWPSRSIEEAHDGLRNLADADFSGALDVGDAWVFVLDGQVVGISDGTMDDLGGTAGTAYQAPGEALPLLFAMQSTGDAEPRAQYYTEETPLDDVDETLSAGGFTGYLELSENVLSGDYYVVYHGGRSRAVAVVGTREEVILGEEAYRLAADEVGIYDVIEAPISVTEIPDVPDRAGSAAATGGTGDQTEETADDGDSEGEESTENVDLSTSDSGVTPDAGSEREGVDSPSRQPSASQSNQTDSRAEEDAKRSDTPTVDPSTEGSASPETVDSSSSTQQPADETRSDSAKERPQAPSDGDRPGRIHESDASDRPDRSEELEAELERRTDERDRLRERIDELESGLDASGDGIDAEERTDRAWSETVGETSLFVRYESQSDPTLEDIGGGIEKESLASNLVLDYHTNFDDSTVSIDGVPFEDALHATAEWSFLTWLVRDLPFEIRDTGRVAELGQLYDALPRIDRVELGGSVGSKSGDGSSGAAEYDFICRDKTGNPLLVADIHEGRAPVDGPAVEDLIERTSALVADVDSIAAAYVVSPSFFRPAALEAAQSATASGFLSRDSRLSYVKVDRNAGFHLWLVEARNDFYHVTVPEL